MRRLIEYTLVSADGVFEDPAGMGVRQYQDETYLRDKLGLLAACDALLFGRRTYELFAKIWSPGSPHTFWSGSVHPWRDKIHAIRKYVFSSTLDRAEWNNSTLVRGDAVAEVARLKQQEGGDLLILGHGRLAETLLKTRLIDAIDLSIHPVLMGHGKQFFREGQGMKLRMVGAKAFSKIVTVTYEPQASSEASDRGPANRAT